MRGRFRARQILGVRQIFVGARAPKCCKCDNKRLEGLLLLYFAMLDGISNRIERYMDLLSARQRLAAANIANVDTPGYHTQDVDFRSEFRSQIHGSPAAVTEVEGLAVKNDGNNVSLDREARMLAENALRFNIASNLMRSQIRMVRAATDEGKSG
jgi:flagellar basal-body rod protein FlgB